MTYKPLSDKMYRVGLTAGIHVTRLIRDIFWLFSFAENAASNFYINLWNKRVDFDRG